MRGRHGLASLALFTVAGVATADTQVDRVWLKYADHVPEYCLYVQVLPDRVTPAYHDHPLSTGKYRSSFGTAWNHMHHYCWGLEAMFEATQPEVEPVIQRGLYSSAVSDFDYVLERMPDAIFLKPEIFVQKGLALTLLERHGEAIDAYTDALAIRADYVPAYIALSGCFERFGDLEKAASILRQGLEHAPQNAMLLEKLGEFEE